MIQNANMHINDLLKSMSDRELAETYQLCQAITDADHIINTEEIVEYPAITQLILCLIERSVNISGWLMDMLNSEIIHRWCQENPGRR